MKIDFANLQIQYQLLDEKIASSTLILDELQERDDNIYRVIFEAEPIPSSIRQAGVGGVNRYNSLEGYADEEMVINTSKRLDQIAKQLYVQSKSYDEVIELATNKEEMLASIPAIQPIPNKNLITLLDCSAILLASSLTVIASGIFTSRLTGFKFS
mgnify:CR=1 FL=1